MYATKLQVMGAANGRRLYTVTLSLTGCVYAQDDPSVTENVTPHIFRWQLVFKAELM